MKRTIERITRTAMLTVAFMLCATTSAWAATPVAEWTDFRNLTSGGYTWKVNSSCTIDPNTGVLTIGKSGGLYISRDGFGADDKTLTIAIDAEIPTTFANDRTIVDILVNGNHRVSVAVNGTTMGQCWDDGSVSSTTYGKKIFPSGRQLFIVKYKGGTGTTTCYNSNQYIADNNDLQASSGKVWLLGVGCYNSSANSTSVISEVAEGMKIYSIRLYGSRITEAEVTADYNNYYPANSYLTLSGTDASWSTAEWNNTSAPKSASYITVTENTSLNVDADVSVGKVFFNVANGKTLTLTGSSSITASSGIYINNGDVSDGAIAGGTIAVANEGVLNLTTKNLELDGAITKESSSSVLTVTGYISGTGTTPMLTLADGATLKPKSSAGGLTVTESLTLSGSINIDLSEVNLSDKADGTYFPILTAPASGEFNLSKVSLTRGANSIYWVPYSRETATEGVYELGVYLTPEVTWSGASGTWTDTSFNGGTDNYTTGHPVVFSDSGASNDPLAITVSGAKTVIALGFTADNRDVTLSGDAISAGTVSKAGDGIATVNNALSVTTSISVTDGVLVLNPTAEVVADEWTASDNGTLVVYVDSGNTTTISIPITATKLIKRGAGVLILENAANTISQGTIIEAGTIKVNQKNSDNISQVFGSGSVTIAADGNGVGGALDVNNCYVENQIYICGNGPDGNGALINNISDMGSDKKWKVSLTGNASWGGSKYIHFGASSSIVLNGHTFTKKGSNNFPLNNTTMSGNGTIVVEAGQFQNNNKVNNLSGIDIVIKSDATLNMAGGTSLSVKNCTFEGTTATVTANATVANSANLIVNGTLTVNGTLSLPKLEMASGSGISFAGTGAAITVGNAFTLPASGTVTLDVTSLTLPTGTDKLTLFSTTTALDLTKFSVTGNSDYYLQQNAQDAETNPGAVTLQLYAAKDDAGGYYRDATGALLAMAANHSLTLTILDGTEEDDWTADELSPRGLERSGTSVYYVAAKIGSTPYNSLQGAVDAATGGETIMLAFNSDDSITLNGKNIVFSEGSYTFSGSFTGNGTLIMTALPKSLATTLWSEGWTGTLWLKNITFPEIESGADAGKSIVNPVVFGNANSTLRLTSCRGGFSDDYTYEEAEDKFPGTLDLVDENDTPAFTVTSGWPAYGKTVFAKLTGSGTLTSGNPSKAHYYQILDASEFRGTITIPSNDKFRVGIGSVDANLNNGSSIADRTLTIQTGASATIAAGKTWSAPGGVVVDGILTLATSTSALSGAVTGSGRIVCEGFLPSITGLTDSNWTGTVELKDYVEQTDGNKIIKLNLYGNSNSKIALNGVTSTMFAKSGNAIYPAVTLKEIEIGENGWTDTNCGPYTADVLYTAKLTGHGTITVKTSGSGTVKFIGDHTFDGSVAFDSGTGKQVAFMRTSDDTIPAVTAGAIVVAGRSNMSIASGKTWTAPGGIKIDGSLTVLTAEAATATSVTPTAYKDGAQMETSEDAIAGTTTYATGMVVSNQDSMGDVTVIGGQSISGSGGMYMSSLTINDGATLTYDPVITPIRVESAPVFNGTGKLKLAARYAGVTCGKFHLVSYPSSASVSGTLADLVDSTSFNNASYTVTEETVGDYKQLVLTVGDYANDAKDVSIAQFGDSITEGIWRSGYRGTPNYRIPLMQLLEAYGYRPEARGYRSVGSTDANGVPADDNYKWHTGISAQRIYTGHTTTGTPSDANLRAGFMESIEAHLEQVGVTDIITLKIGTNDSIGNETADNMFEGWTNLVWKIVRMRPTSKIVVCAPVKIRTGENNAPGLRTKIADYMALTPEQGGFPAGQVTMINGINIVTDDANYYLTDNVHPNWNGHLQLANAWLPAVTNAFESMTARATTGYTAQTVASAADAAELAAYRAGYVKLATFTTFDTKLNTWGETPYSYVNNDYKDTPMGRVAYFVARKTTASPDTRYVWVDMDADATTGTTLADFGVPTSASVNGVVNNLHIYSNSSAIENVAPTVSGVKGTLMRTEKGVDKADGISADLAPTGPYGFDWNDTINGSGAWGVLNMARIFDGATPTNHRKLLAAQMLFDFNGFNGGRQNALGIGDFAVHGPYNYANDSVDHFNLNWTFTTDKDEMPTMDARALETGVIEIWGKPLYTATIDSDADFSEVAETVGLPVDASACDLVITVTADSTLTFGSALSVGSITFNIAENKTLTLASESNLTVGKVTVNGPGKLQLSSSGTFGRMEVASNATVGFADGATLTVSGALSVTSGATLTLEPAAISTASSTIISAASISGTVSLTLPTEAGVEYSTLNTDTSYKIVRTPDAAFSFDGTVGATPTGWITSWGGEKFSDGTELRVGPNATYPIVHEVYHVDDNSKAHPYAGLSAKTPPFSLSFYADLSKLESGNRVLAAFGNSSNGLIIYKNDDAPGTVRVGRASSGDIGSGWIGVEYPKVGYHLYTITCAADGTLSAYVDDGATYKTTNANGTKIATVAFADGFQIGSTYGGNIGWMSQGSGMALCAMRGYDAVLEQDQVAVLSKSFPATTGVISHSINLNASGKTLKVYSLTESSATVFGPESGDVVIPAGNTVDITNFRTYPSNASEGKANTVTIAGTLNVNATDADSNIVAEKGVVIGYYLTKSSNSRTTAVTVQTGGELNAPNAYILMPWAAQVASATLNIRGGTVKGKALMSNQANKGTVNLSEGGVLEVSTILSTGQAITKNFGKGTFRITDNATEGRAINFQGDSAENATVLDPNGHTLTLAAAAVTGSGYIKIACGTTGTVVFNGGSNFTGTVIIDANAATVQGTIPGTLKSGVADNCVCSVTVNATTTYYPTFASAIEAAGENEITVYGYNNETLPDHYRVKDGKLELIPGTIFSVW